MLRFLAVRQFARTTWNAARATRPDEVRRRSPCRIDGATHVVSRVVEIRCGARRSCRRLRPSHWCATVRRRLSAQRRRNVRHRLATQSLQQSTEARRAVSSWVEPVLYPVQGRQRGDLRRRCGSALIRKAKSRRAIAREAVPFVPGRRRPVPTLPGRESCGARCFRRPRRGGGNHRHHLPSHRRIRQPRTIASEEWLD